MKYGFIFFGGDARQAADYAAEAETAGWDGFFVPDAIWGYDPWVTLAGAAVRTEKIKLGTMLTPASRRRPWKLASETLTLDHLSDGRVILAVGLGALDTGFANFGEVTDRKTRAELLDETLDIVTGLWKGQPFNYNGKHYQVKQTTFVPERQSPVQQPRIPIWVTGAWPREKSMKRVVRYDGVLPNVMDGKGHIVASTPETVRAMKVYVDEHRALTTPFDIVVEGVTPGNNPAKAADQLRPLAEAGATWWLEGMWIVPNNDLAGLLKRIRQGPPRIE